MLFNNKLFSDVVILTERSDEGSRAGPTRYESVGCDD